MSQTPKRAAVILAAGKSTRMKSSRSKVLHHIGGRSLLAWVADLARSAGVDKIICVVGEQNADVRAERPKNWAWKSRCKNRNKGTADAVLAAKSSTLREFEGQCDCACAPMPLS